VIRGTKVKAKVLAVHMLSTIHAPHGKSFKSMRGTRFVVLTVGFGNLGPKRISPAAVFGTFLLIDGDGRRWEIADRNPDCRGITATYASLVGAPLAPTTVLHPVHGGTTVAVYSVRSTVRLKWEDSAGLRIALPKVH
jgi:hypothetical protein